MGDPRCSNLRWCVVPVVSGYVVDGMNEEIHANNVYDECEVHHNCTVEIWKNSRTGEVSIGWYENGDTETE